MKQIIRANWQIPAITFGLTLLSFALLLPALHYYLDDWPMLYSLHIRGAEGIKQLYLYDGRPFAFWPHLLLYQVGGTDPVFWHLANYLLRWLTGIFLWGAFKHLWPNNRREVSWAAILFAIYPLFAQQSMGLTFIVIWTGYLLYSISLFLMVSALRNRKYLWLLLFLSILVSLLGLVTLEYFIGVEFLRPLIIWIILSEDGRARAGIKQALKFWSPYLLATALYLVWRFFFVESVWRDLTPSMLSNFLHDPITTALQLVNFLLRDTLEMTLGVWFPAFDAAIFDLTAPVRNLALLLSLFVTAAFVFVLLKQRPMQQVNGREDRSGFWIQSLSIGLAGVVLGCAPGWLIGRSVTDTYGLWNDRFGLAAMFGASYFIIGSLGLVSRGSRLKREIFLAILVGFAVGRNFTVTDEYRWSSTWQNQFYSQLKWRAPYIESGTSILADNEMFPKMGVYATSFALNMLYPGVEPMPGMDYWFFTLHKYFPGRIGQLAGGIPVSQGHWYATFEGESQNSLVIAWHPREPGCVWVLTENDRYNPLISANTVTALGASNLDRIDPLGEPGLPSWDLFGAENRDTWCYYYETADLARQLGNWDEIPPLYVEAEAKGFEPANGIELMPFIEGYARSGDAGKSLELTIWAAGLTDNIAPYLCNNLKRISADLIEDRNFQSVFESFFYNYFSTGQTADKHVKSQ